MTVGSVDRSHHHPSVKQRRKKGYTTEQTGTRPDRAQSRTNHAPYPQAAMQKIETPITTDPPQLADY